VGQVFRHVKNTSTVIKTAAIPRVKLFRNRLF